MFSDTTPVDVFGDLVLGRDGIDNYLLTRMDACGGVLLDTTFARRRGREVRRSGRAAPGNGDEHQQGMEEGEHRERHVVQLGAHGCDERDQGLSLPHRAVRSLWVRRGRVT